MNNNPMTLKDFLSNTQSTYDKQPKTLQFQNHPLAVVIGLIEMGSTLDRISYHQVFECDDYEKIDLKPDLVHLIDQAEEICEFYHHTLVSKTLRGVPLSGYDQSLQRALNQMKNNVLDKDLLPLVTKLREFYHQDKLFENYLTKHNGAPELQSDAYDFVARVRYVATYNKAQRNQRDFTHYLFADENEYLYEACLPKNKGVQSLAEQYFAQNGWFYVKCAILHTAQDYRTGMTYFKADGATFVDGLPAD